MEPDPRASNSARAQTEGETRPSFALTVPLRSAPADGSNEPPWVVSATLSLLANHARNGGTSTALWAVLASGADELTPAMPTQVHVSHDTPGAVSLDRSRRIMLLTSLRSPIDSGTLNELTLLMPQGQAVS